MILQAIVTVMSQNPEHILHIADVFLHKASHIINRCDKTSTLTPFCPHFNPLQSSNLAFYTQLLVSTTFLFPKNRRHGEDGHTDGQTDSPTGCNAYCCS